MQQSLEIFAKSEFINGNCFDINFTMELRKINQNMNNEVESVL